MYSCLEIAIKSFIDFVLIQKFWIVVDNIITILHVSYYYILSNSQNIRSRVAIYVRKQANLIYCQRIDLNSDFDIIIINVSSSNINTFQIINIYNEKSLDSDSDESSYTVKRSLQHSNTSDSDHEIIRFNIRTKVAKLVENSICSQFFNLKKAD